MGLECRTDHKNSAPYCANVTGGRILTIEVHILLLRDGHYISHRSPKMIEHYPVGRLEHVTGHRYSRDRRRQELAW